MKIYNILVVEDDPAIRRGVVDALEFDGKNAIEASSGKEGIEKSLDDQIDLVLLDLTLPIYDGFHILAHIKKHRPTLPVLILTARGGEAERVRGLKSGADDYVVKPFSIKELLARVDAVLRRSPERPKAMKEYDYQLGKINFERSEIIYNNGKQCELSEKELELIEYLISNSDRALSREELLLRVWNMKAAGVETRTVDMHVARLRDKLGDSELIQTVRGKGYKCAFGGKSLNP